MKNIITGFISKSCIIITLLCSIEYQATAAGKETILFEDDFSGGNTMYWSEFVPGQKKKCNLVALWERNDGEGNQAMRVQLTGLWVPWAGVRSKSFVVSRHGKIKVSFWIKARNGDKFRLNMSGAGGKWQAGKNYTMGKEYRLIEFTSDYSGENATSGRGVGFQLLFQNNTDVHIKDVKISLL